MRTTLFPSVPTSTRLRESLELRTWTKTIAAAHTKEFKTRVVSHISSMPRGWRKTCSALCATFAVFCILSTETAGVGSLGAADEEGGTASFAATSASSFGVIHGNKGRADAVCVAFVDKVFVRSWEGSRAWAELGPDLKPRAYFSESFVSEDASLIQMLDQGRGLRLFFDARDADAVLAYWCIESPSCVWNILVTDGELRRGSDVDCTNLKPTDPAREEATNAFKVVNPEMRVAPLTHIGGIAMVTAGTTNLVRTSSLSSELNMRYARLHGYAFYQYHDVMVPKYMVTWNKVRVLIDMLDRTKHEWIMWLDTDAVVTNRSIVLEDIITAAESLRNNSDSTSPTPEDGKLDLLVCDDIGGWELNTGVMLWRNTEWSRSILEKLWVMEHLPHMRGAEQGQLIQLLRREDPGRRHHHILHQSVFNTHPKVHHDGLFIIHMMGFSEKERVMRFSKIKAKLDGS